jgi:hypothetical protein
MQEPRAQRTLVKSPPELWAEVSDVEALARHLGEFGEIRITRLEPETTVAWEGDRACGTVALEPAGWGTKVTITAKLAEEVAAPETVAAGPEPEAELDPEPVAIEPEPVTAEPETPDGEVATAEPEAADADAEADAEADAHADPEPADAEAQAEPEAPKVGFFARLFGRRRKVEPVVEVEPEAEPVVVEPEPDTEPVPLAVEPEPEPVTVEPEPIVEPEPVPTEPEPVEAEPQPARLDAERAEAILTGVLDDLGSAHHRPFSRS